MATDAVPEGFVLDARHGRFSLHNGPYYVQGEGADLVHGLRVLDRHLNGAGVAHGGMLAAFMDMILARTAVRGSGRGGFTIRLVADYVGMARRGDWIEGRARMIRQTRTLAFVEGGLSVGRRPVLNASGVFRLSRRAAD
jgi:uncharacterized protein (TIGR00369 family)